jgi:hypothetical protein
MGFSVSLPLNKKWALLIATILLPVICVACENENRSAFGSKGRTMEIHAEAPQVVDRAFFVDKGGKTRILVPGASNRQLVVVEVTVVNRTSTVIPFVVDEEGVQLGDRRAKRYGAINPFEKSKLYNGTLEESRDVKDIVPVLWGETDLARKFQVGGYIVFDIPKGTILGTLFWDDVEYVPVDFIDYWKGLE